jgi:RNA polymerase sporulation-specific sigma factor
VHDALADSRVVGTVQAEARVREARIQENMALVYGMARRLSIPEGEWEDVIQAGFVGLTQAVNRFDPKRGVQFSTYAVPLILGEMREQLRRSHTIRVGRRAASRSARVLRLHDELTGRMGRQPTLRELAEAAEITPEEAAIALEAMLPVASMDEADEEGGIRQIKDENDMEEQAVAALEARAALARLDERQRRLVLLRFYHDQTQSQVSRQLGISQVQVSRLEKRALQRLREQLGEG